MKKKFQPTVTTATVVTTVITANTVIYKLVYFLVKLPVTYEIKFGFGVRSRRALS